MNNTKTLLLLVHRPTLLGEITLALDSDPDFAVVSPDLSTAQFRTGLIDGVLDGLPDLKPGGREDAGDGIFTDGYALTQGEIGGTMTIALGNLTIEKREDHFVAVDDEGEVVFRTKPIPGTLPRYAETAQ